jgi:hypothetical protein
MKSKRLEFEAAVKSQQTNKIHAVVDRAAMSPKEQAANGPPVDRSKCEEVLRGNGRYYFNRHQSRTNATRS